MGKIGGFLSLLAFGASIASSSPATYFPQGANNIRLAVAVPSSVASSGTGDIFVQLQAPASYRWVAMGIGSQMAGSTMFIMYADGTGNVTISPRDGQNHVMPTFDSSIKVELLAGSGVSGNVMKANVKYTVDSSVLKASSSDTNWISAWQEGSALNSKSTSATITQHDAHDQFTFDLTKATVSSDANPFVAAPATPSSGSGSGSASSTGSSSATGTGGSSSPTSSSGSDPLAGDTGSGSGSSSVKLPPIATYDTVHGVLMAASFVVLLPTGAIFMNVFGGVWVHAVIQMLAFFAIIAAFGVGIHLAKVKNLLFKQDHTILGLIVVILLLLQPFLGLLHHRQYKKLGQRSYFGHAHMWYGRLLIVLGVINGGLGLRLAGNTKNGEIAYGVVAGVICVLYIVAAVVSPRRKGGRTGGVKSRTSGSNGYEMH